MLTITPLSSRAIEIVASGRFTGAEVASALDRVELLDGMPKLDILIDVSGSPSISLSVIGEELRRLPLLFRLARQVERVAIVADAQWVRIASRIESALIPACITKSMSAARQPTPALGCSARPTSPAQPEGAAPSS